jgi:hypothetical protein
MHQIDMSNNNKKTQDVQAEAGVRSRFKKKHAGDFFL